MDKQEIESKYKEIKSLIDDTENATSEIKLVGDDENAVLTEIRTILSTLNNNFKDEIDRLEHQNEWDRFCIAFFGETNAGKSTIIDSLRILYNEETRLNEFLSQKGLYVSSIKSHIEEYSHTIMLLNELNNAIEEFHTDVSPSHLEPSTNEVVQPTIATKKEKHIIKDLLLVLLGVILGFLISHFGIL